MTHFSRSPASFSLIPISVCSRCLWTRCCRGLAVCSIFSTGSSGWFAITSCRSGSGCATGLPRSRPTNRGSYISGGVGWTSAWTGVCTRCTESRGGSFAKDLVNGASFSTPSVNYPRPRGTTSTTWSSCRSGTGGASLGRCRCGGNFCTTQRSNDRSTGCGGGLSGSNKTCSDFIGGKGRFGNRGGRWTRRGCGSRCSWTIFRKDLTFSTSRDSFL